MLPKRVIFTMVRNTDFLGSRYSIPYNFRHYDLSNFTIYLNGRQIPSESLSLDMTYEKTSEVTPHCSKASEFTTRTRDYR